MFSFVDCSWSVDDMLVLTRWSKQKIIIGNDVTVEILKVVDGNVYVGITAPKDKKVLRDDLYARRSGRRFFN